MSSSRRTVPILILVATLLGGGALAQTPPVVAVGKAPGAATPPDYATTLLEEARTATNPALRRKAIEALPGDLGDAHLDGVAQTLSREQDPLVRQALLRVLVRHWRAEDAPVVLATLNKAQFLGTQLLVAAFFARAEALGVILPEGHEAARYLVGSPHAVLRLDAARTFVAYPELADGADAWGALRRLLVDEVTAVRQSGLEFLAARAAHEQGTWHDRACFESRWTPLLLDLERLTSDGRSAAVRALAVAVLHRLASALTVSRVQELLPAIWRAAGDADDEVARRAYILMADHDPRGDLPAGLGVLFASHRATVQAAALAYLERRGELPHTLHAPIARLLDSEDATLRRQAALNLLFAPSWDDPDTRRAVAVLSQAPDDRALARVRTLLRSPNDPRLRLACLSFLASNPALDPEGSVALLPPLTDAPNDDVVHAVLRTFRALADSVFEHTALAPLDATLAKPEAWRLRRAWLSSAGIEGASFDDRLVRLTAHRGDAVRFEAWELLGWWADSRLLAPLSPIQERSPQVRAAAAHAVGALLARDPRAHPEPFLIPLLHDQHGEVRAAAARAWRTADRECDLTVLIDVADERQAGFAAVRTLRALTERDLGLDPRSWRRWWELFQRERARLESGRSPERAALTIELRLAAARALGRDQAGGGRYARAPLLEALNDDPAWEVQVECVRSLERIEQARLSAGRSVHPAVIAHWRDLLELIGPDQRDAAVRLEIIAAIGGLVLHELMPSVLLWSAARDVRDEEVKRQAVQTLGLLATDWRRRAFPHETEHGLRGALDPPASYDRLLGELVARLKDRHFDTKLAAIKALGALFAPGVGDGLHGQQKERRQLASQAWYRLEQRGERPAAGLADAAPAPVTRAELRRALIQTLYDPHRLIAHAGMQALVAMGREELATLPPDPAHATLSPEALRRWPGPTLEALIALTEDESRGARQGAFDALAEITGHSFTARDLWEHYWQRQRLALREAAGLRAGACRKIQTLVGL